MTPPDPRPPGPTRHQIADGEILVEITGQPDDLGCVSFTAYRLHTYDPSRVLSDSLYGDLTLWTARHTFGGQTVRRWTGGRCTVNEFQAARDEYWNWLRSQPRLVRESALFRLEAGHRPWLLSWVRGRS